MMGMLVGMLWFIRGVPMGMRMLGNGVFVNIVVRMLGVSVFVKAKGRRNQRWQENRENNIEELNFHWN